MIAMALEADGRVIAVEIQCGEGTTPHATGVQADDVMSLYEPER